MSEQDKLPELTAEDRAAMAEFPADAVDHWWLGEKWVDGKWVKPEVSDDRQNLIYSFKGGNAFTM